MPRTDSATVQKVTDYDGSSDLDRFITTAEALVDWLESQDADNELNSTLLAEITTYLAAHFYEAHRDKKLQQKTTGRASGTFQGATAQNLASSDPGQTAMTLDVTNRLARRNQEVMDGMRRRVGVWWMGTDRDSSRPDTDVQ